MIYRRAFIAKIKADKKEIAKAFFSQWQKPEDINVLHIFSFHDLVMIYMEDTNFIPIQALFGEPDFFTDMGIVNGKWVQMEDIFHYNRPKDELHWQRKEPGEPVATLARIRHDKLASYMHYHYILQEYTGKLREKYGVIYLFDNYLMFYRELPAEKEQPWYESKATGNIPENWQEIMNEHFAFWEDIQAPWRGLERWV